MKTHKLYWDNPYLAKVDAKLIGIEDNKIILNKTIIYPLSGGQQADKGFINDYEVLDSWLEKDVIIYQIDLNHQLKVNEEVILTIDWDKRYKTMKNHLAIELIHLILKRKYPKIEKIGSSCNENKGRLDYIWKDNISKEFPTIQKELNDLIIQNKKVHIDYLEDEIRYWQVEGYNEVLCCGTHIKTTSELVKVRLKRKSRGHYKERIEVVCE